jgi:hypothetical protein
MKKTNIILFLLFILTLVGVGAFYLGYYGYEKKLTSAEIKNEFNKSMPIDVGTTVGTFRLNGIEQIEIHADKKAYFELSYVLTAINKHRYKGSFYFEAEILDNFKEGNIRIRNVQLLRTSTDDAQRPLGEGVHKLIDDGIQRYILDRRFQYAQVFDFHENWRRKVMFYFLQEMSIEDNHVYLKFGLDY